MLAPAGTPANIVAAINRDALRVLQLSDVKEILRNQGFEPVGSTPEQFGAFIRSEITKWTKVIQVSGAKLD